MSGSKKDIAKQFELPERQSKIASILKESEVYCICRSTDSTSFMIACDNCEEWFHGHCVNINEVQSRQVKHYYCSQCRKENPGLKIEYKKPKGSSASHAPAHKEKETVRQEREPRERDPAAAAKSGSSTKRGPGRPWKTAEKKAEVDRDDEYQPYSSSHSHSKRLTPRNEVAEEPPFVPPPPRSTRRGRPSKDDAGFGAELKGLRQCYQPKCRKAARPSSKYCSDECGLILAATRMQLILPSRIQEWSVKSVAEEHNDRDLTEIKRKYDATYQMIKDLQLKRDKLDEHIAKVERLQYDPEHEEEEDEEEGTVTCVSCGRDVPSRDSVKHMEKCYHKYESQMSFGSKFATSVEGTPIFCDFFNQQNKTYCKRLRVLCNEHTKEPKISDTAICGCPADNEVKPGGRFCRNLKKICSKHFSWEKLRRGEIDQERVRQFMKIDDLLEQERVALQSKQDRGGVMGLLLNSTYDHELDAKMAAEVEEHKRQKQEYEEQMRQREENARRVRQEQEAAAAARMRYEQEMIRRRAFEMERAKEAHLKREEMKMRQQMLDARKAAEMHASAGSSQKPTTATSASAAGKSVSRQLVAAVADKKNVNYSSSSASGGSRSGSFSGSGSGSDSGSGAASTESGSEDERPMEVDDADEDARAGSDTPPAKDEDRPWQDSFVHLPSKREKTRRSFDSGDGGGGAGEMTASRLSKK